MADLSLLWAGLLELARDGHGEHVHLIDHRPGCPQLNDREVTCTCARIRPTLPFVTRERALELWGEDRIGRYLETGLLKPSRSRDGYWFDIGVVSPSKANQ